MRPQHEASSPPPKARGRRFGAAWAVLDQGLASGAVFAVHILLSNWLERAEYGAFAIAFAGFVLAGAAHSGVLTEPMMVFGHARFGRYTSAYTALVRRGHWLLTLPLGVVVGVIGVAVVWVEPALGRSLMGLGVALPGLLWVWFARYMAYARLRPVVAVLVSAAHAIGLALLLIGLEWFGRLGGGTSFLAMGLAGLPAAAAGLWVLRSPGVRDVDAPLHASRRVRPPRLGGVVLRRHWRYGRWALATNLLMAVPLNGPVLILSGFAPLSEVASLRMAINLLIPISRLNTAVGVYSLPRLSTLARRGGTGVFRSRTVRLAAGLSLLSVGYGGMLMRWPAFWGDVLYGSNDAGFVALVIPLGIGACCSGVAGALATAMRAAERPRSVALAQMLAAAISVLLCVPAAHRFGAQGAAVAITVAMITQALALLWLFVRRPIYLAETR